MLGLRHLLCYPDLVEFLGPSGIVLQAKIGRSIPTSGWDLLPWTIRENIAPTRRGKGKCKRRKKRGMIRRKGCT
jgi:hypothetical protein